MYVVSILPWNFAWIGFGNREDKYLLHAVSCKLVLLKII